MNTGTMIRILLVDDHQVLLDGIGTLLAQAPDMRVAAIAHHGEEALAAVRSTPVDVGLLDINMPVMDDLEACGKIKAERPVVKVIAMSMHGEGRLVKAVLNKGASGYLLKNCGGDELLEAIRTVHGGGTWLSREATGNLVEAMHTPERAAKRPGLSRVFGGPNSATNRVYARSVAGANRYEFEFSNPGEGYQVSVFSNTLIRHLNWTSQPGLNVDSIYQVRVRASKDGGATWCNWGWACDVTIAPGVAPGGENLAPEGAGVAMWPNPNNGQQLRMEVDGLTDDVRTIAVDIHDLSGKRVVAREVATQHGAISLDLNGSIAAGTYVVTITVGDRRYVERLVIAH